MFVLSFVLTSLFSLFYVSREGDRFLHQGCAEQGQEYLNLVNQPYFHIG